ncbi:MAG: ACP S-malonyltransferase [Synergistales bacterium]|jgi:[acyl-carrier-protein] S-malonyltransferase|nr:ACP S-malonyltransferase [Synergistales bacterium]
MSYALLFPGQGSQEVGMAQSLVKNSQTARSLFQRADEALGFSLSRIVAEGPDEELRKTEFTQPAILVASLAAFEVLREEMGSELAPFYLAGHSLGEYSALVASGVLALEDGVRLVHLRGRLMQEAVPLGEGAMAALLGLAAEQVREICAAVDGERVCEAANFNAPGQIVISGHVDAIDQAIGLAKSAGAKRALPLNVSAPFHCRLMRPVADRLDEAFAGITWCDPMWPIVTNSWATAQETVESLQKALFEQTYRPVLWEASMALMSSKGVDRFLEVGPGKVLTGLAKKCLKGSATANLSEYGDLEGTIAFLKGGQ